MSLRSRIVAIGVAVLTLAIVLMATLTYVTIRVQARSSVDDTLQREADRLITALPDALDQAAGADGTLDEAELTRAVQRLLALNPGSDDHLAALTTAAGTFTTDAAPDALDELRDDGALPLGATGRLTTIDTEEGPVRVLELAVRSGGVDLGRLSVLASLVEARQEARDALVGVLAAGCVALAVGAGAIVVATRRALRPLSDLAAAAKGIEADLTERMPEPARRDEVGVLADELNVMLDRLAVDGERRRALLAAVSHELRTPLAVARGHLEVFRTLDAEPGSAAVEVAETVEGELARIGRLVDDLGAVARGVLDHEVELGPVFVPDVVDDLRRRVDGLGIEGVELGEAPPAVIDADSGRLAQSLLNLVLNASAHTPAGTKVVVATSADADEVVLQVIDDGPGIDPSVADDVFEPFVTTSAGGGERHSGLGLAVVRALTEAQGGRVELTSGPAGTTVSLHFARTA